MPNDDAHDKCRRDLQGQITILQVGAVILFILVFVLFGIVCC